MCVSITPFRTPFPNFALIMVATKNLLSKRISTLPQSATIQMAQMSRDLRAKGIDVIDLSLGEPDFDTPQHIKEAAKKALDDGYTHYTPVPGLVELRDAISRKFQRDNQLSYSPDQIVVSTGAKQSIANLLMCLLDPEDEIIIPSPFWVSYAAIAQVAESNMINIPATIDHDFKITPSQLEAAISSKTKAFLFSSPCNPTGSVYSREELAELAEVFKRYEDIVIISDEIYEYINFGGSHESIGIFPEIADRVVTVNGFSKGFAMTGWRIGYVGAPQWLAKACSKMQGQFTSGANAAAQKAAAVALDADMSETYAMKQVFLERRKLVYDGLSAIEGMKVNMPNGAFYFFPNISTYMGKSDGNRTIENANDLAMYLLEDANVSTVSGIPFGDPNCIRLSYAASTEKLQSAIERISNALAKLQ